MEMILFRIVLLIVALATLTCAQLNCCVCKFGDWPEAFCFPHPEKSGVEFELGKTCADVVDEVFPFFEGSDECNQSREPYEEICCTSQSENPVDDVPPVEEPEPESSPQGTEDVCYWCGVTQENPQGHFPEKPYSITVTTNIPGNPTCAELYDMGINGFIPFALCYPIQLLYKDACGCHPRVNNDELTSPPPPVPAPPVPSPVPPPPVSTPEADRVIPQMMYRPPDLEKDQLKLSAGRQRGATNTYRERGLKGESSQENPIFPLSTRIVST